MVAPYLSMVLIVIVRLFRVVLCFSVAVFLSPCFLWQTICGSAPVAVVAPFLVPLRRRPEVAGVGAQVLLDDLFIEIDAESRRIRDDGESLVDQRLTAGRSHQLFPPRHVQRVMLE